MKKRNASKKTRKVTQTKKVVRKTKKINPKLTDKKVNESFSSNASDIIKKRYVVTDENGNQETPAEVFHRVANALAAVEKNYDKTPVYIKKKEQEFFEIMGSQEFTPAGRTLRNAGAKTALIANCIVLPVLDSMESIFQTLKDASLLQQAGSGLGFSFSHLRPAGFKTKKSNGMASGPVSFLRVYNEAFGVIKQQGRHGANMAIMRVDHPDILEFIHSKKVEGSIRNFNISVGLTHEFMKAVTEKPNEPLMAKFKGKKTKYHEVLRTGNGAVTGFKEIDITAKELFDQIIEGAWQNGEPGIVNLDEANKYNPLPEHGELDATNPCGEQFLHHYDVCNLGSVNLGKFVRDKKINWSRLRYVTRTSVRMLDNVIDSYDFPVKNVTEMSQSSRRIGLGIMGFADMLYQMNVSYRSEKGRSLAEKVMGFITTEAHKMSHELGKEKGVFPLWKKSIFAKKRIKMRNAALTTVAPTGSISMMLDSSSGIEPEFALTFIKQDKDGVQYKYINPYFEKALKARRINIDSVMDEIKKTGSIQGLKTLPKELRETFVVSLDLSAEEHIRMQAAFQKYTDNSISKTINFPNSATREDVAEGFILSWKLGCKGSTFYRDGSRNVQILNLDNGKEITSAIDGYGEKKAVKVDKTKDLAIDKGKIEPRHRPEVVSGKTYRVKTGYGKLYVTVNNDESGAPLEVFATLGKSGGFFQEQSEGLCRLISMLLRSRVKVAEIINDLKGIRGPMPVMTNKGTILSLPDAIAQVLLEHVSQEKSIEKSEVAELITAAKTQEEGGNSKKLTSIKKESLASNGMMPGCPECGATLRLQEGCILCMSCGFSRCG